MSVSVVVYKYMYYIYLFPLQLKHFAERTTCKGLGIVQSTTRAVCTFFPPKHRRNKTARKSDSRVKLRKFESVIVFAGTQILNLDLWERLTVVTDLHYVTNFALFTYDS